MFSMRAPGRLQMYRFWRRDLDFNKFSQCDQGASKFVSKTLIVFTLAIALLSQTVVPAKACGPETLDPIFVFEHSPDLPFDEFVKGNMGVLRQTFGRKTLVIAYRYLSGGTFTGDEQTGLVEAL